MAGRAVAVQAFKVELRAARIAQFRRIGMGAQDRAVSRYVVSHKLAEDWPASGGVSQTVRSIVDVSAIADTTCDKAIEQCRKTVQMDPNFAIAHLELGQAFVQEHRYDEAIVEFQKAIQLSGGSIPSYANLAYAYAMSNRRNEAVKILNDLKNRSARNASEIALVYVALGEKDQAMKWLEKAYEDHFNPSILLRPAFGPLRFDPCFQNLVHRIGLPG
jgi:Flp pilus assembly protein TadD